MKTTNLLYCLLLSLIFVSCKDTASAPVQDNIKNTETKVIAAVKPEQAVLKIEGMTCAIGCAKAIEEKLTETQGIQKATVDFEKKEAIVNFDLDKLSSDQLKKIIESTADGESYTVVDVKVGK
jgi:Cu+-exporting ATPase